MGPKHSVQLDYLRSATIDSNNSLNLDYKIWKEHLIKNDGEKIQRLSCAHCQIKNQEMEVFQNLGFPNLLDLRLHQNMFTGEGLKHLVEHPWPNLKILSLSKNKIGGIGIKYLVQIDMPSIQVLNLRDCQIRDDDLRHMTKGRWSSLKILRLRNNLIVGRWSMYSSGFTFGRLTFMEIQKMDPINLFDLISVESKNNVTFQNCYFTSIHTGSQIYQRFNRSIV